MFQSERRFDSDQLRPSSYETPRVRIVTLQDQKLASAGNESIIRPGDEREGRTVALGEITVGERCQEDENRQQTTDEA